MSVEDNLRKNGRHEGRMDREPATIATFLATDKPTELMIVWIDAYIDGWLDLISTNHGRSAREMIERRWDASTGAKWGQRDIIEDIRIARRDWQNWIDAVSQKDVDPDEYYGWDEVMESGEARPIADAIHDRYSNRPCMLEQVIQHLTDHIEEGKR